jgi:hypothetical protein
MVDRKFLHRQSKDREVNATGHRMMIHFTPQSHATASLGKSEILWRLHEAIDFTHCI